MQPTTRRTFLKLISLGLLGNSIPQSAFTASEHILSQQEKKENKEKIQQRIQQTKTLAHEIIELFQKNLREDISLIIFPKNQTTEQIYQTLYSNLNQTLIQTCYILYYEKQIFSKQQQILKHYDQDTPQDHREYNFIKILAYETKETLKEIGIKSKGQIYLTGMYNKTFDCDIYSSIFISICQIFQKEIQEIINYTKPITNKVTYSRSPNHIPINYTLNNGLRINIDLSLMKDKNVIYNSHFYKSGIKGHFPDKTFSNKEIKNKTFLYPLTPKQIKNVYISETAYIYFTFKQYQKAIPILTKLIEEDQKDILSILILIDIYTQQKEKTKAQNLIQLLTTYYPSYPKLKELIIKIKQL